MTTIETAPRGQLLRILGVAFAIAVTIGNMIGSGVLRAPSAVAAAAQGAGIVLTLWLVLGVISALEANVFVELGTALPKVGGPYVFARRALGDVPGLIVGWSVWLAKLAGIAAGAVSFANFLALLAPGLTHYQAGVAVGIQIVIYGANILGLREGRALQQATSFVKAVLLFVFAVAAATIVPPQASVVAPSLAIAVTWIGIVGAMQLIRGAYSGWEAPLYFSEESTAPGRDIPRGVFIGLGLVTFLYLMVNWSLLRALGIRETAASALPFVTVLHRVAGPLASWLFAIGAMITVLSVANANIMSAPRVLFALARDRLLPRALEAVNEGGSPHWAFLLTALGSIALAATGEFVLVFGLIGTLDSLVGVLTIAALFVLRRREPDMARPFRALGYPLLPGLALAIDLILFVLFNAADVRGFVAAAVLSALCIPFAWLARRSAHRQA